MKTLASFRSKLLALTLALMASVSIFAYDYHGDLLCYNILTDSTVAVTGQSEYKTMPRYEYLPENLVIPSEVTLQGKTYTVISIDQWAFYACTMLKSVIIPTTVTSIGLSAFQSCENLAYIEIPTSVTTVEGSAFSYTKWYDNLPYGEVYINNTLYRYKGTAPENTQIVVKDGTTRIAGFTFWNQSNIVSIELPQTLTVIEHGAFQGCTQLSSVLIPKNVASIGANAFAECTGLTEVVCLAPTPPITGQYANPSPTDLVFAGVDVSNTTLYVPTESVEAYKTADQWKEFGQILPIQQTPEDLFPTLWGLQRTSCTEWYENCEKNTTSLMSSTETEIINNKQYLRIGDFFLREENQKVLIYSRLQNKDHVLYDYSLEVGDKLTTLNIDFRLEGIPYGLCVVDYSYTDIDDYEHTIDTITVTEVSYITLLDGKQYKKWKFNNNMEYVEGIGSYGSSNWSGDFFQLINQGIELPTCLLGERLVCASRNNKLLYCMDDAEMERLGTDCLCDYDSGPKKDNARNGKIGGRPTPTQWNMLEMVVDKLDKDHKIISAETFSYILENDSTAFNGKTFYHLTRQSTKDTAINKSVVGALHFGEDEDNRVYFLRDGVEYILYDFTAEPGDTVEIFAGINNYPQHTTYTHVVTGKDTIENGACRIQLEVIFPEGTATVENVQKTWLAGLGSIDGIVHNAAKPTNSAAPTSQAESTTTNEASSETQTSVMLCAWRDDDCLYTTDDPDYNTLGCVYNQSPTSVGNNHMNQSAPEKILLDGQLFIRHNGQTYNILGIEL